MPQCQHDQVVYFTIGESVLSQIPGRCTAGKLCLYSKRRRSANYWMRILASVPSPSNSLTFIPRGAGGGRRRPIQAARSLPSHPGWLTGCSGRAEPHDRYSIITGGRADRAKVTEPAELPVKA
ncbi:hypothetical protein BaRGS_00016857, partial [Batillaria attramentaria]